METPKNRTNKAVAYLRVSTDEQAQEGISLQVQRQSLEGYAAMRGLELVQVIQDVGVSAGIPLSGREGGERVIEAVFRREVGAVLAFKLDRLFRDCADCLTVTREWDDAGVALHMVDLGGQPVDTSTAMGRFFLTVMAGAAEMERNLIRERTASAMAYKARNGEYLGGRIPYGYDVANDGVKLVPVEREQKVVRKARKLRKDGLSLRAIAAKLHKDGVRTRSGRRFAPVQIKRMLAA
jgi:site-specific DNA recombinase